MSVGGQSVSLDPEKDVLININAQGAAVPSARFMGGREQDLATGGPYPEATQTALAEALNKGIMLTPAFVPETGPYRGCTSRWVGLEPRIGSAERGVAVAFYLALVTRRCLELVGHRGKIIVEGPFARNRVYLQMLSVATRCNVVPMVSATGTSQGAALLVKGSVNSQNAAGASSVPQKPETDRWAEYAGQWAGICC
ncbi:hypothetical protein [Sulfitobacter geojensis]|uniref:hypothetical protein n=1 Tax=Sulfitobacter geojensis TaxID=1342299 RepID=UPI003BA8D74C